MHLLDRLSTRRAKICISLHGRLGFTIHGISRGLLQWNPVVRRLCLRINAADDIGGSSAWREKVAAASPEVLANGGSCVAGPDGEWW